MRAYSVALAGAAALLPNVGAAAADSFPYVSGAVTPDGTALVPSPSYTVEHPKTGKYVVTFTTPFKPVPSCLATPFASQARFAGLFVHKPKLSNCIFFFEDIQTGQPEDTYFTFIAVAISH